MTNGDREGHIFLSHPQIKNGLFFLLTIKYHIFILKKMFPEICGYAEMRISRRRHFNITMTSLVFQREVVRFLSFPRVGTG